MSQMNPYQQQEQQQQSATAKFRETWEWEGEHLVLAYNPYDLTRAQMRPDYSRLVGERGVCQPVVFRNKDTGEDIRKFVVLARVKAPAEPGSLVPDKHYRCFRLYDTYMDPRLVDWGTLVFYEIRPRDGGTDASLNESQRFMNTLLSTGTIEPETQKTDSKWAEDFARIQQAATLERPEAPQPQPEAVNDDAE